MNIKITNNCYGLVLSTVAGKGRCFSRIYNGYEVEEAKELFKNYVINELTKEILSVII